MKMLTKAVLATSLCLIVAVPAQAGYGHNGGRIFDRMERQQARIEHGIENGELTRKEVKKLKKQQRRIRHLAREFRDDGRLSKKERRILHNKLDKASSRIREFKHNEDVRYREHLGHYGYSWNDADDWGRQCLVSKW